MIRWILFSTLATGVFYGLYLLLFRRDAHLQLRRWYLMGALAFSLVYPLVRMPEMMEVDWSHPGILFQAYSEVSPQEAVVSPNRGEQITNGIPEKDWAWMPLAVWLTGCGILLLVLLVQLGIQMAKLHRKPLVMYLDDETDSYSFFNHLLS